MTKQGKTILTAACVTASLTILLFVLLAVRGRSTAFADGVARSVTQALVWVTGHLQSALPFSVFELWLCSLAVALPCLIILLIRALVKKKFFPAVIGLFTVAIFALGLGCGYALTAGTAYYRSAPPVPQSTADYSNDQVADIAAYFLQDYNALADKLPRDDKGNVVAPSVNELSRRLQKEYERLTDDYYFAYTPRAKGVANSWYLTLTGIGGITFVPLGEPTVNLDVPPSDLPQTMAHEMAHAKGIMREGDCNFVSYYILLTAQDDYLRYCGYFSVFWSLLSAVDQGSADRSHFLALHRQIDPRILREQKNAAAFWTDRTSRPGLAGALFRLFDRAGEFFNDLYLKLSGADNGTGSYGDATGDGGLTDTGQIDPDTQQPIYKVTYSSVQKMFFALYERQTAKTPSVP